MKSLIKSFRIPIIWLGYFYFLYGVSQNIHNVDSGFMFGFGAIVGAAVLAFVSAVIADV